MPTQTPMHNGSVNSIRILHKCESRIENSVSRITNWHHEACQMTTNIDHEGWIFLSHPHINNELFFFLTTHSIPNFILKKHEKDFKKIMNSLKCDMMMSF